MRAIYDQDRPDSLTGPLAPSGSLAQRLLSQRTCTVASKNLKILETYKCEQHAKTWKQARQAKSNLTFQSL
eukprot:6198945-Pleurochrysis_carterae.AAC.1